MPITASENIIDVKALTYNHLSNSNNVTPALVDLALSLPKGSRTLLIGANGGKEEISMRL